MYTLVYSLCVNSVARTYIVAPYRSYRRQFCIFLDESMILRILRCFDKVPRQETSIKLNLLAIFWDDPPYDTDAKCIFTFEDCIYRVSLIYSITACM